MNEDKWLREVLDDATQAAKTRALKEKIVYTCTTFTGYYPVGSAAVVRANSPEEAAELLNKELIFFGLQGDVKAEDMIIFNDDVKILNDGDY